MRSLPAALIVLSLAAPALAQDGVRVARESRAADVEQLPISLQRIQRELRQARDLEAREGLNLRYTIQIYGSAPPLQIFSEDDNLVHGPVPYGAPTHQEIINHITPKEYRAPFADFSALLRWLADRKKK
jgi:hypothetical protein